MYISSNPNNELEQSIVQVPDLVQIPEEVSRSHDDVYRCNQRSEDQVGSLKR